MRISTAESLVMEALWRSSPRTAEQIAAEVASGQDWTEATVKSLLNRLLTKGAVAADKDGRRYLYRPLVTRQKCVRAEGRSFLKKVFAGDAAELLVHFVQDARMTPEQIEELKRLLDAKRTSKKP